MVKWTVFCPRCGSKMPTFRKPTSVRQALWGGSTCPQCGCEMDRLGKEISTSATQSNAHDLQRNIMVRMKPTTQRIKAASEKVHVPSGVVIKVKRSRSIEHTVEINWSSTREGSVGFGIKDFLNSSIRGVIEQQQGRTYQESETMEYEIELNGKESSSYTLIWTDIWRDGIVGYHKNNKVYTFPLRFREGTELEVLKT